MTSAKLRIPRYSQVIQKNWQRAVKLSYNQVLFSLLEMNKIPSLTLGFLQLFPNQL